MTLQSVGFKSVAKIMKGSCVFCFSSCISFNLTSHIKHALSEIRKNYWIVRGRNNIKKIL